MRSCLILPRSHRKYWPHSRRSDEGCYPEDPHTEHAGMMTRRLPALCLFLLAPLIGELLLGNLPLTSLDTLAALPVLALLYGAGAIVIREITVRTGRSWPTILILAVAYGVLEEGLITQSLFNPSYNGLSLNAYGQFAGLGVPWALFVITIHSVWSIVAPSILVESLFPAQVRKPWLRIPGLVVAIVLYLLGAAALMFGTIFKEGFIAEPAQLIGAAVVAAVLIVIGFTIRPTRERSHSRSRKTWPPMTLGISAFIAGSLFFALYHVGVTLRLLPPAVEILGTIALIGAVVIIVALNATRPGWHAEHRLALATGAVLVYCWAGVLVQANQYGLHFATAGVQAILIAGAVALVITANLRVRRIREAK